ncbi:MAG TPA: biosynthetic arginine decarboxylase, partial [Planctomycetota bacterium]|nr:biosynthetic arginine decarboxylase [Planctomycetota bacterium]
PRKWTLADSIDVYEIRNWGAPFFGVNEAGNVMVHADGPGKAAADLKGLVDEVRGRGIGLPLLVRFTDILRRRVAGLNEVFRRAIAEAGYKGEYRGCYPIKVNQVSSVVREVLDAGRPYHFGLEAGSKPELLAVCALLDDPEALIICNGYKDEEYVETALRAQKLGRNVVLIIEKVSEIALIGEVATRLGARPTLGLRIKLSTRASGKLEAGALDRAQFGIASSDLVEALARLRDHGLLERFEMLQFHLGSQVSAIRVFKNAMREASRFFVELRRAGAPLRWLNVGGGLGVDYDGSRTNFASSVNYTLEEYAADIVYAMKEACDAAGVPHPNLVSQSGRWLVAHHAVLVVEVVGATSYEPRNVPDAVPEAWSQPVKNLLATFKDVSRKNLLEAFHDAVDLKDECLTLFSLGHLGLEERILADNLFRATCHKVLRLAREMGEVPEDMAHLERDLSDTYFCNFSIFQSMPDAWAIDQLFPIVPIHRLKDEPARRVALADITCDAEGRIDHFIDRRDVKETLPVHPLEPGKEYLLGIFLVGAYQEILGDLHNLYGDTNDVQVSIGEGGGYVIERVDPGDTVADVLRYVSYPREELVAQYRKAAEAAVRAGRVSFEESGKILRAYEEGLGGYTYLERE